MEKKAKVYILDEHGKLFVSGELVSEQPLAIVIDQEKLPSILNIKFNYSYKVELDYGSGDSVFLEKSFGGFKVDLQDGIYTIKLI